LILHRLITPAISKIELQHKNCFPTGEVLATEIDDY